LDNQGRPYTSNDNASTVSQTTNWDCVVDQQTALVWEIKTIAGLHRRDHTYTWYDPNPQTNGGSPGTADGGRCSGSACDTASYVAAVNRVGLCGLHHWRLPTREELRSLVDYQRHTPAIDSAVFPNTKAQFYWSSTPDAAAADSAWGIGFTFGYDYSYFKSDLGYIRLVATH